ncbi:hypothetical protein RFI_25531 [Reticulomyxa filosa]|uniref:Leucine rich repeat protein n=1 Tax=Reticulomyxa filosa TaxID=46433 RepID=X6MCV7_RETFI|nr:hypothetical protein RFI_25531 [Reticulomyxa filosa]|eukprot:ETO11843.1 hypothetical protein RFI_25531 [Reticulomyxa filosa]
MIYKHDLQLLFRSRIVKNNFVDDKIVLEEGYCFTMLKKFFRFLQFLDMKACKYLPSYSNGTFGSYPFSQQPQIIFDPWQLLPQKTIHSAKCVKELCFMEQDIDILKNFQCTRLELLDVSHNQLISLAGIEKLKELNCLNCSHNKLHDLIETLTILSFLNRLEYLDIQYNPIFENPKEIRKLIISRCPSLLIVNENSFQQFLPLPSPYVKKRVAPKERKQQKENCCSSQVFKNGKIVSFGKTFDPKLKTCTNVTSRVKDERKKLEKGKSKPKIKNKALKELPDRYSIEEERKLVPTQFLGENANNMLDEYQLNEELHKKLASFCLEKWTLSKFMEHSKHFSAVFLLSESSQTEISAKIEQSKDKTLDNKQENQEIAVESKKLFEKAQQLAKQLQHTQQNSQDNDQVKIFQQYFEALSLQKQIGEKPSQNNFKQKFEQEEQAKILKILKRTNKKYSHHISTFTRKYSPSS